MFRHSRLPAAVLVLLSLPAVMTPSAIGEIVLEVSDDGTDMTLQWSGFLDVGVINPGGFTSFAGDLFNFDSSAVLSVDTAFTADLGVLSGEDPWIQPSSLQNLPTSGGGTGFGFNGGFLSWDVSFGATPGVISPNRSWVFEDLTVASAFGTNLDSGDVLLWTHNTTGDTISVGLAPVPEPTSLAMFGIAMFGLSRRRRR